MDNSPQPTAKQNVIEALRSAESIVITTSKNPSRDEIAAAIGLHLFLGKLEKVAEVVITKKVPSELEFLPRGFINQEIQGQRDFIIELDQTRTEADRLKYLTEDGKLKVYITPYNGVYSKDDVSFAYGDYHCDAIIGLGASRVEDLDPSINKDPKLTQNAKFIFITSEGEGGGPSSWADKSASSVCEMIMSMSEALGSGMMDRDIATALFTGIVDKTEHFTNTATSPKVMTMAAQLLAAGANQAQVVKQLAPKAPETPPPAPEPDKPVAATEEVTPAAPEEPARPDNEFQLRKPHHEQPPEAPEVKIGSDGSVDLPATEPSPQPTPPPTEPATTEQAPPVPPTAPQPAFTGTVGAAVGPQPAPATPSQPPQQAPSVPPPTAPPAPTPPPAPPAEQQPATEDSSFAMPRERVVQPPAEEADNDSTTPAAPVEGQPTEGMSVDLEAARRAVEEAHQSEQPPSPTDRIS